MRNLTPVTLMFLAVTLSACVDDAGGLTAPHTSTATPGSAVMRVEHTEVMPNAFGGKDALGRKRPTGTTTVFLASTGNGTATFRRQDVDVISGKTTLNAGPRVISTGKKATDVIVLPSTAPQDRIGAIRETTFTLNTSSGGNSITIDGHKLVLLSVNGNQISYSAN